MSPRIVNAAELPVYDGGHEARSAHSRFLAYLVRAGSRCLLPGPAPSAAQLERHARRFGPAQVAETAAEFGVSVAIERATRKPRLIAGPSLKQRVAGHVKAGRSVELIAEIEDLSPSRARRLVAEVATAEA